MKLVLEFGGAKKEAIYAGLRRVAAAHRFRTLLLPAADEEDMTYEEFRGSLEEALKRVSSGDCGSVQIEGDRSKPFLAGLCRPRFAGQRLADWSAWAEGSGLDAEALFDELQGIEGLGYIALSVEESADFDTNHVTVDTFPWSDWRLIAGAVRAATGAWVVQRRER